MICQKVKKNAEKKGVPAQPAPLTFHPGEREGFVAPRRGRRPRSRVQRMSADDRFTVKSPQMVVALIVIGAVALVIAVGGFLIQLITGPSMLTGASAGVLFVLGIFMVTQGVQNLRRAKK